MLERIMADNGFPSPLAESRGCRVFQFQSETGEGVMTQYDLFPGVYLMYNDFHMEGYDSAFHTTEDILFLSAPARRFGPVWTKTFTALPAGIPAGSSPWPP